MSVPKADSARFHAESALVAARNLQGGAMSREGSDTIMGDLKWGD